MHLNEAKIELSESRRCGSCWRRCARWSMSDRLTAMLAVATSRLVSGLRDSKMPLQEIGYQDGTIMRQRYLVHQTRSGLKLPPICFLSPGRHWRDPGVGQSEMLLFRTRSAVRGEAHIPRPLNVHCGMARILGPRLLGRPPVERARRRRRASSHERIGHNLRALVMLSSQTCVKLIT
jgi:hypothetical protein